MIRTITDFQSGLLEIPNATAAPNANGRTEYISDFIAVSEREILLKGLGAGLYLRVKNAVESGQPLDAAILNLLDGSDYTYNGRTVIWQGLRDKYSFISYYIFSKYVRDQREEFTTLGTQRPEAANSMAVSPLKLITDSYRKFHEKYQGHDRMPYIGRAWSGNYLDYYGTENTERSLYQFLIDNKEDYLDSDFTFVDNINSFGL